MGRRRRNRRPVTALVAAYMLVLLFLAGLLVERRPADTAEAGWAGPAVPALAGSGTPGAHMAAGHGEHPALDVGGGPAPPWWQQWFRPDLAMARRLLEEAVPLLGARGGAGQLILYGEPSTRAERPGSLLEALMPFVRSLDSRFRSETSPARGGRTVLPGRGLPAGLPGSGGPGTGGPPAGGTPHQAAGPGTPDAPGAPAAAGRSAPVSGQDPPPAVPGGAAGCGAEGVEPVAGGVPLVGIYHTHDYESYISELPELARRPRSEWKQVDSDDPERNIIRVGARLARALCERGVTVVHAPMRHAMTYLGAYFYSQKTARRILEAYPTVRVLLDVHRDGVVGRREVTADVGGLSVARVYLVVGEGSPSRPQPFYPRNRAWAEEIHRELERRYPGLSRGVLVKKESVFNQHLSPGAVLIEIGGAENEMAEALRTADLLAGVLADLIRAGRYPH